VLLVLVGLVETPGVCSTAARDDSDFVGVAAIGATAAGVLLEGAPFFCADWTSCTKPAELLLWPDAFLSSFALLATEHNAQSNQNRVGKNILITAKRTGKYGGQCLLGLDCAL
jgi:hypothetical protein